MNDAGGRAKEVFFEVIEHETGADRAACLAQVCGDDLLLKRRVEHLLNAHDQAGNFLGGSADSDQHEASLAGTKLGRFTICRMLGSGNFGTVWLATDPLLKRDVAIKVAHVGVHARADLQERFEREARLAARLHHPNIVPVFEPGVDNGRLFIVSEYCHGQNMADWLTERDGPLDPHEAARLIRQLADAVDHAHRRGLIHRDIKPGNILLMEEHGTAAVNLVPRLTDFGLARDLTSETAATKAGLLLGTAAYMSPEQATGSVATHGPASDVFSLGVLLYRLIAGTEPFAGENDFEIIRQITLADPAPPTAHAAEISRDLASVCMKCLEKHPDRRYATAAELRDDVDRVLRNEPTIARPIRTTERIARWARREPSAAALVVVVCLTVGIIITGMGLYIGAVKRHADAMSQALHDSQHAHQLADAQRQIADTQRQAARETSYRSDLRLAFDFWQRGRIPEVQEILSRQIAADGSDLRGPEWFVLDADVRARFRTLGRHSGAVTECVLSQDGTTVYTTGTDGLIRIWNRATGEAQPPLNPHLGELHALALSPDGSTLAVGGKPWLLDLARVFLVNAKTGARVGKLQSHRTTLESIAFSPDGKWLAAGSRYEPVQVTRLENGQTFTIPAGRRNRTVSFSADSRLLVVAAEKFTVWQLDGDEPTRVHDVAGSETEQPYLSRFAATQPLVALSHLNENHISLVDATESTLQSIAFSDRASSAAKFTCLEFSPDDRLLAAGDESGTLRVWEPGSARQGDEQTAPGRLSPIASWTAHAARATSVAVTSGHQIVSTGEDGSVAMFAPFATGAAVAEWEGLRVNETAMRGNELLVACQDGTIRRVPLQDVLEVGTRQGPAKGDARELATVELASPRSLPIRCLAVSADDQLLAAGTTFGGLHVYRLDTGALVGTLAEDLPGTSDVAVRAISFSSTGEQVAFSGEAGNVIVADVGNGKVIFSRSLGSTGYAVAFLAQDRLLAVGGQFEGVRVFELESGQLLQTIADTNTESLDCSGDGRRLASAQANGTIEVLDANQGTSFRQLVGHVGVARSNAFSRSGRSLISIDDQCTIRLTDVSTGIGFGSLTLVHRPSFIKTIRVHCNQDFLAAAVAGDGLDLHVHVWRLSEQGGQDRRPNVP